MSGSRATCFHEVDPKAPLARRATVEGLGTALLTFVASASAIAASRLAPGQALDVTVVAAFATSGALVSLIVAFGKLSGGHYNPLITILQLLAGERTLVCTLAYAACQLTGGLAGGAAAALIWRADPTLVGGAGMAGAASEFVAAAGLMLVVFGSARSMRPESGPFAVGAWLVAAIVATPTGSYANPAVALGATVTAGPLALGTASAAIYIAAQVAGALSSLVALSLIFPGQGKPS